MEMAAHSSILAWKVPQTEEPGRLQSMGSERARLDRASMHTHTQLKFVGSEKQVALPKWVALIQSRDLKRTKRLMIPQNNRERFLREL